jgi:hypothetical protein
LAFAEVAATGQALKASMEETYSVFGFDPAEMTSLEAYLQDYYGRIIKKIKEVEYEREKQKKRKQKRTPFKKT